MNMMSVKQERAEPAVPSTSHPPPPPLLHQGVRVNPPPLGQFTPFPVGHPLAGQPMPPALQPSPAMAADMPNSVPLEASMSEDEINKRIDKASIKGTFGWETVDTASIPCIFRNGEKFVSVRMVEQKLLSKYPSTYPQELRDRPPLMSQFITSPESRLLNEINIEHCACEYGQRAFTEKDLVVSLKDFSEFYRIVRKHFPNEVKAREKQPVKATVESGGGGWVQVNNTVVPYIRRHTPATREILNLAPLPVIKYAAGLLTNTSVPSLDASSNESKLLSDMCKSAGLDFNFTNNTPLILLQQLPVYCSSKILIKRLPDNDPFGNAEYSPEFDLDDAKIPAPLPRGVMLPTMQDLSPQGYANRLPHKNPYMTGPPNVTVQPGSAIPFSNMMPGYMPKTSPQQTSTQSLQALEKIAGPPRKKQRVANSPAGTESSTPSSTPRASPAQLNGAPPHKSPIGPMMNTSLPQQIHGVRPGAIPFPGFGQPQIAMTPPGALNRPGWTPTQKELADMMNMQAAILSGQAQAHQFAANPHLQSLAMGQQVQAAASATATSKTASPTAPPERTKTPSSKAKPDGIDKIQPVEFHGKKISCLVKGNEKYALIEAISRVYFPHCSLDEFVTDMTNVLQIPIYQLDHEEEKAFISFYGLPTKSLKCNKVLKLTDLDRLMPQLKYMFKAKEAASATTDPKATQQPKSTPPPSAKSPSVNEHDTNNNGNQAEAATVPAASVLPPVNPFAAPKKASGGLGSKLGKLEDAVNRLRQTKMMQMENTPSATEATNGVNDLGQGQIPRNPFLPK